MAKKKFNMTYAGLNYYGPQPCPKCQQMVCTTSEAQGSVQVEYPAGPIYPNTKWELHQCPGAPASEVAPPAGEDPIGG